MTVKNLKKAFIEPLNGKQKGKPIEVLFNPGEYSVEKSNTFQSNSVPGLETPLLQFASGDAESLSMELFFDTYTYKKGEDIRKYTDKLVALLHIDAELHAPPVCRFVWGKFQFKAIIERLTQKYTMFLDDGTPVRATLNVTFKEYRTITEQLQEIGRESADRTKRKVIKEGDSLWLLAAEAYGNAAHWRPIARKNEIHNPRKLEAGREIRIPPLDK